MSPQKRAVAVFAAVVLVGFISCGDDNDEESHGGASVTQLILENSVLPLGGSQVVSVQLTFSSCEAGFPAQRTASLDVV